MIDRGKAAYIEIRYPRWRRNVITGQPEKVVHVTLISPTRQREKALHLTGRQLVKYRKAQRRAA